MTHIISLTRAVAMLLGFALPLTLSTLTLSTPAFAFGSATMESASDSRFTDGQRAVKAKDFGKAVQLFQGVVTSDPRNADAWNYLAYSQRNLGQLDDAMKNYNTALSIKPNHKGALEYQGELYLMLNNQAAAEANLQKLTEACKHGCAEKDTLQAALEHFKESKSSSAMPQRTYSMNY